MENERYSYSPLPQRPVLRWPNDARLALWIIPNIEHFRFTVTENGRDRGPHVPDFSERDYGNRVGVWRLMDILDKYHLRATVALNSDVCRFEPEIIRAGMERGWEWMGHGVSNSERLPGLGESSERALIQRVIETIKESTGAAPRGWLGPGRQENLWTPDLLAEAGIVYVVDWAADDLPFPMRVKQGRLIAMPYSGISDMSAFQGWHWPGELFERMICDQFDVLYEESLRRPRVLSIALHPFLTGRPYRAKYLDRALKYVTSHDGLWLTTGGEIADWYLQHAVKEA
jgi:peptidoglycan/xylan/chitin deacetylase (PgdA/CDA1 family)